MELKNLFKDVQVTFCKRQIELCEKYLEVKNSIFLSTFWSHKLDHKLGKRWDDTLLSGFYYVHIYFVRWSQNTFFLLLFLFYFYFSLFNKVVNFKKKRNKDLFVFDNRIEWKMSFSMLYVVPLHIQTFMFFFIFSVLNSINIVAR